MTLWIVLTVLAAVAAAVLAVPLVRRYEERGSASPATQVYRDQLAEIDGQERGGSVSAIEADALRTEAKRRLLAEDRRTERAPRPLGSAALGRIAIGVAALTALGSTLLYSKLGSPDLADTSAPAPAPPVGAVQPPVQPGAPGQSQASIEGMVAGLETRLKANPGDMEGWRMLGLSRYTLNQFPQAAEAYRRAVALQPANGELNSAYGETLVLAANGTVAPTARSAFEAAVKADPTDARARYFLGLARDQAGDRPGAIGDWIAIANEAAPGAPYVPGLVQVIEAAAKQANVNIAGRLKTPTAAAPVTVAPAPLASAAGAQQESDGPASPGLTTAGALPNPSAEQIAAAQRMPPGAQQEMIRGMVDRLAARLKSNPQDPEGWLRLIRARMVMGDAPAAAQARREALAALTDPAARRNVETGAKALGVPGA